MSAYVLTPLAKADIFAIWTYMAEASEPAVERLEQAIYDACAFLAEGPLRGHTRHDLTPHSLRFWTLSRYPNYMVVYRPEISPLENRRRSSR
jgi:plasmid stabilization system protein ParE